MNELIELHNTKGLLDLDGGEIVMRSEVSARIAEFERRVKEIKDQEDALKKAILEEMERYGIIKLSTPEVNFTYVAATDRESLDAKALKAELPEVYDTYCKISPVKPSIRIKVN